MNYNGIVIEIIWMKYILLIVILAGCISNKPTRHYLEKRPPQPFRYEDERVYYFQKTFWTLSEFEKEFGHKPDDSLLLKNRMDARENDLDSIYGHAYDSLKNH